MTIDQNNASAAKEIKGAKGIEIHSSGNTPRVKRALAREEPKGMSKRTVIRLLKVRALTTFSKSWIYELGDPRSSHYDRRFRRVKIGVRRVGWIREWIDEYLDERMAACGLNEEVEID